LWARNTRVIEQHINALVRLDQGMKGRLDLRRIGYVADHPTAFTKFILKSRDGFAINIEGEHPMACLRQCSCAGQPDA